MSSEGHFATPTTGHDGCMGRPQRDGKQGHPSREVAAAKMSSLVVCNAYSSTMRSASPSLPLFANGRLQSSAGVRPDAKARKEAVKKMEGVFEDIAFETDQMAINAMEYCD